MLVLLHSASYQLNSYGWSWASTFWQTSLNLSYFPNFFLLQHLIVQNVHKLFLSIFLSLFYAACCFDEQNRVSVLCLFNASFESSNFTHHNSIFCHNLWPWLLPGQYNANTCPMTASSATQSSHGPPPSGDVHRVAPPRLHCHGNSQRLMCIFWSSSTIDWT